MTEYYCVTVQTYSNGEIYETWVPQDRVDPASWCN